MPPETTLWNLEPHTVGKHLVLKNYMDAWLPIMGRWNGRVLFIDAFAGPGEYSGGESGSPIIALSALTEHGARQRMTNEFVYVFIEKDFQRSQYLRNLLSSMKPKIPSNCTYHVINSTFDEALTHELDRIEEQRSNLAPALVMIDPFGVSETPMTTIARILANPKAEVYISFMYSFINRFLENPAFEPHLDELFGSKRWREAIDIRNPESRKRFIYGLYRDQLKSSGAKQVLHVEMYDDDRLVYAIFFGTQSLEGSDKMKEAIWKVDPSGNYTFRSGMDSQLHLGPTMVDYSPLKRALYEQFKSITEVSIEAVVDFVKSDETDFHSGQLRTHALRPMEAGGTIEVIPGTRRRRNTYPSGTKLRFLPPQQNQAAPQPKLLF